MTSRSGSVVDNPDVVPYALSLLGGGSGFVDVEDVAVKCFELSPRRFGFRKHQYPNYKTFAKALRDFEDKHPEMLLRSPDGLKRQLSAEGVQYVHSRRSVLDGAFRSPADNPPTRRRDQRLLNELRDNRLTQAYLSGGEPELSRIAVADVLMCSPDSPASEWERRCKSMEAAAMEAGRDDLAGFLRYLLRERPEWFGGSNK